MHSIHKSFWIKRTVFLSFFIVFSVISMAQAADPLFTIENVAVDVTGKNAVEARGKAFEEAQVKAFETLKERMFTGDQIANVKTPDVSTISTLIQDFEVNNEQLSTVRYKANYTIRFKDSAVKQYLAQSNRAAPGAIAPTMAYTDRSARPALVLPFYQRGNQTMLWSPYNVWMQAWNRTNDLQGVVPLIVPLGDLGDVQDISDDEALNYDPQKLGRMLRRYEAGEAIILIAAPDQQLARVEKENDAAVGTMEVQIYRTDRGRPEFAQSIQVTADGNDTLGSLMNKAVAEVKTALRQNWKAQSASRSMQANSLRVRVGYNSLKEWADTQRALKRVYGVTGINIKSVSPQQALLDINYQGDPERLSSSLEQVNMMLSAPENGQDNDAMSYYSSGAGNASNTVYDLTYRRYR